MTQVNIEDKQAKELAELAEFYEISIEDLIYSIIEKGIKAIWGTR